MPDGIHHSEQRTTECHSVLAVWGAARPVYAQLFLSPLDPTAKEPLYAQIAKRLDVAINTGKLLPGDRLPSEAEFCQALAVSRNTVMRAFNDLRDAGLLFRERGSGTYIRQSPVAPSSQTATLRLGIVSPTSALSMNDLYLGGILAGVSQVLGDINAVAVLGSPSVNPASDFFAEITRRDIDGFIVIAPSFGDRSAVSVLAYNNVPFVQIGSDFDPQWDSVVSNNRLGAELAFKHLRTLGHTRLAYIGAPDFDYDSSERWAGLWEIWRDSTPPLPELLTQRLSASDDWTEKIHASLSEWLRSPEPPTGLFAAGFPLTLASIRTLIGLGVSLPSQLSLVGYDDYPVMEYITPPPTTIRQPLAAMGATAARLLAAKVRGQVHEAVHHVLPVHLVERRSTSRLEPT